MDDRAPGPRRVVVAAAIFRGGSMLAARRSYPPELAGQWELPGGKVEVAETDSDALTRECREELGIGITVLRRVGSSWPLVGPLAASHELHVWTAALTEGEPRLGSSHDEWGWFAPEEWAGLPWLASDRPLLSPLAAEMVERAGDRLDTDGVTPSQRPLTGS